MKKRRYAPIYLEGRLYVVELVDVPPGTFVPEDNEGEPIGTIPDVYIVTHPDIHNGNCFAVQLQPETITELS